MYILLLLLLIPCLTFISADNCTDCLNSGGLWCLQTSQCGDTSSACNTSITVPLNCPSLPQFAYDDEFMRSEIMVITTAAQNENPQLCFDNQMPTMKLYKVTTVNCSTNYSDVTCVGYTAYDTKRKVISISFKGAHGQDQINQLMNGAIQYGLESYYTVTNGKIFKIIQDSFMLLWNGGMQADLRYLKYKYPSFELWVNGHSLGSALAWAASAWIVNVGLYKPEDMKVVVMGAARISDYNFAVWHTQTFPYNFHILHRSDPVAHTPTFLPTSVPSTTLFYPKTEVWYNNYMNPGDPYQVCQEADGPFCSGSVDPKATQYIDHLYYFNIDLPGWGHAGCPMNISAYAQP
ncbi:unnamed protein product [Caenorhabditis nigoni]